MWQFYSNAQFREDILVTKVQGREVSFSAAVINQLLGTSQDAIFSFNEVQVVPLSEKALSAEDWLLHRFSVNHLVGRSGSLNTLSSEDLILVSTLHQGIRLNFGRFMMERIHFMVDKILRQKVTSSKQPIGLPYGMSICRLLECLDIPSLGLQVLPPAEKPLDHVSLLRAHFCQHQGIWVRAATLTKA